MVDDEEYEGTPGLWDLIVSKNPTKYTNDDYDNYKRLLIKNNTLYLDNNPNTSYPKGNKSKKWKNLLSPIWERKRNWSYCYSERS